MHAFEVLPRYSCGSPAMVDERTARRVIEDEKNAYPAYQEGAYGEDGKRLAEREGLEGIVISGIHGRHYVDNITGRDYGDMPYGAIRWPEKLYVVTKGREVVYYYRRQELACWVGNRRKEEGNHMAVLQALRDKHQIDPFTKEAELLWSGRTIL